MKVLIAVAALIAATITAAWGETYPVRPITMVVPFGAGGPTDALARILGQRMSQALGQQVIIENVTGAAGTNAGGPAPRAAPGGAPNLIRNWGPPLGQTAGIKKPVSSLGGFW